MAQMAVSEGGRFIFPYTITSALSDTNVGTLNTTNKFLDKDIDIKLTLATAAATVSASKQATSPTIARTTTTASGATNVGSNDATTAAPSSGFFISTQATAPATTLDITKTVGTPGYLGVNTQITASAATTAKTGSIYYIPITTGVAAADTSSASITIETTDDSSKAGVNVQSILGTAVDSEPTSGYFLRIKANASGNSKVTTAGWFPTGSLTTSSTSTTKFYPVTAAAATISGTTAANKPTITRTDTTATGATNIGSSAASTSAPSSGYFIATRANAPATTVSLTKTVGTIGYLGANTQISASASTSARDGDVYYIPITTGVATTDGADVALFTTDGTNNGVNISAIVGTKATSEPTSGYYLAFKGSGNSRVSTAGWFPTGSLSTTTSDAKYFPITAAVGTVTGTNTVTPSASLSSSNVTLSDTNNGISVTATGGGTASVTAAANITTAGYAPQKNNFASATLNASNNTTTATKYISAITIPSNKSLTITNNGTATMTTSGTANITSTGTTTVTSNSTSAGTITIAAKTASGDSSNTSQVVVQNGLWKTTAASAASTYYGRVTVGAVSGSIGGSASGGSATAAISNANNMNTISDLSNKTAGTDYWQVKATATGSAGSYTPKYTVNTAGWIASTVTGTAQSVSVSSDSTGKSIYIPKAVFAVSGNKVYCSTAGYIPAGSASAPVGTVTTGTIGTSSTDPGTGYTANTTAVVPSGGYLTLTAGYYSATKISLATLVPNGSNVAGHANYLLAGKTAYDNDGNLVTGNIATYDGTYTYST